MPLKSAVGVKITSVPEMATVPPVGLLTAETVRVWPPSFAGPLLSLPVRAVNGMVQGPESSATLLSVSFTPVGASFTSFTVIVAGVPPLRPAPEPLVAPLTVKPNVSPAGVF